MKAKTCRCGERYETAFDGREAKIIHGGEVLTLCGGLYEAVKVKCIKCNAIIQFTKDELEGG